MKKLVLFVGAVLLSTTTFSQKATLDNPWSLEGVINYSAAGGIMWNAPKIRARYFVNDNIAARVQLGLGDGLGTPRSESYTYLDPTPNSVKEGTREISRMSWNAEIGGEYHLKGTDRLSPYFMLGIQFGGGSSTATNTDAVETAAGSGVYAFSEGDTRETKIKQSMFGIGVGAGLDFYVYENLYLGVELGFSFKSVNTKDVEITGTAPIGGGATVNFEATSPGNKKTYMETGGMNTAFRLGWRF